VTHSAAVKRRPIPRDRCTRGVNKGRPYGKAMNPACMPARLGPLPVRIP
jgi:hypothetical protein